MEFECPACACRHRAGQREMSAPGSTALDSGRTPLRSGQSSSPRFDSVAPACPSAARPPSLCSVHSESTVSLQVWDRISLSQSQGPETKRCLFQFSAAVPHLEAGVAAPQQLRGVCVWISWYGSDSGERGKPEHHLKIRPQKVRKQRKRQTRRVHI